MTLITKEEAKALAVKLQAIMNKRGYPMRRGLALDIMAEMLGHKNWQELVSVADEERA